MINVLPYCLTFAIDNRLSQLNNDFRIFRSHFRGTLVTAKVDVGWKSKMLEGSHLRKDRSRFYFILSSFPQSVLPIIIPWSIQGKAL